MREIVRAVSRNRLAELTAETLPAFKEERGRLLTTGNGVVYRQSVYENQGVLYCVGRDSDGKSMLAFSRKEFRTPFKGSPSRIEGLFVQPIPIDPSNLQTLWQLFPFTKPVSLRDRTTTIGMGDRIGLATGGHLRVAKKYQIAPVLAQQSIRELHYTERSFEEVVADASFQVFQEGYEDGFGADGDHLKDKYAVRQALKAGMTMITLDLTEVMRPDVAEWDTMQVRAEYRKLKKQDGIRFRREYSGKNFNLDRGSVRVSPEELERAAVMYGPALDLAESIAKFLERKTGGSYDLEVSIDETTTPTLPAHHLFIARELQQRGVKVNSIAPRFVGDFQKAIDYIGDVRTFDREFAVHCEIAKAFGNYKVSVHSGSDKFSIYPAVGRHTGGRLHLKTSGTSWLEAVRTIASEAPDLYRKMHEKVYDIYPKALINYHITADIEAVEPLTERVRDRQLADYLDDPNWRQFMHISYGGLLLDPELGPQIKNTLEANEERYHERLEEHFERHVQELEIPERTAE